MLSKISSMLDAVADSLEAKGLIKEAFEVDKVADAVEAVEDEGDVFDFPYDGPRTQADREYLERQREKEKIDSIKREEYEKALNVIKVTVNNALKDGKSNKPYLIPDFQGKTYVIIHLRNPGEKARPAQSEWDKIHPIRRHMQHTIPGHVQVAMLEPTKSQNGPYNTVNVTLWGPENKKVLKSYPINDFVGKLVKDLGELWELDLNLDLSQVSPTVPLSF